jgi:four helix bundle protein
MTNSKMTNDKDELISMSVTSASEVKSQVFDLEERTAKFGERLIDFLRIVPRNAITCPLIKQVVRSGTSVGANYCEADEGISRRDFHYRMSTCRKEAKETKYWLRMIARAAPTQREQARQIWQEAHELHLIFSKIFWKTKPLKERKRTE